jgi:uncharacterized protein (TIGR00251 family)
MFNAPEQETEQEKPLYFRVKVKPKSGRLAFQESMADGTLKICLKSAPEKGEANEELLRFLAKSFDIRHEKLHIVSGHHDRLKLVKLDPPYPMTLLHHPCFKPKNL